MVVPWLTWGIVTGTVVVIVMVSVVVVVITAGVVVLLEVVWGFFVVEEVVTALEELDLEVVVLVGADPQPDSPG